MKKTFYAPLLAAALFCSLFISSCQKETSLNPADKTVATALGADANDRCMCQPPYTVSITEIGSNSATITWDEMPESIGYRVEWASGNNPIIDPSIISAADVEGTTMLLSNLKPNRQYSVRVINVCRIISSHPQAWILFQTAQKAAISPKEGSMQN